MTTYTIPATEVVYSAETGLVSGVKSAKLTIVTADNTKLSYTIIDEWGGFPLIELSTTSGAVYNGSAGGQVIDFTHEATFATAKVGSTNYTLMSVYPFTLDEQSAFSEFFISLDGQSLPGNVQGFQTFLNAISNYNPIAAGAYKPGNDISFNSIPNVQISQNDIIQRFDFDGFQDQLWGGIGNDKIVGGSGNETIGGGSGADTLIGEAGDDVINGGSSKNDLRDIIYAGAGNDNVDGGYGNDLIYGQDGNDTIAGGFGSDEIQGQNGNDVLTGSALSDLIFGGAGNDFVNGGFGHDRINGGTGADNFYHLGIRDHGSDWIQDFSNAQGDVLVFGNQNAVAANFKINYAHTASADGERAGNDSQKEAFIIYKPTGQIIWALVDGAGESSIKIDIGGTVTDLV